MGLDVFVMPLWKFKAGDFTSPIESALGIRPKYASPDGIREQPTTLSWWQRWRAKREVVAIRNSVTKLNQEKVHWNDEGPLVFSRQWPNFNSIRAYASWLDCPDRLPEFDSSPDGDYGEHPALQQQIDQPSCPHLLEHSLHDRYALPCESKSIGAVEPYTIADHWSFSRPVASSPQLLRDLDFVQQHLQVPDDYEYDEFDPLGPVKQDYIQLRKAALLSTKHGLPIIFWG